MERTAQGSFFVHSWNTDLANLKNYRHIRNQIAHEPDCSEENMCSPEDGRWIDGFYSRILNQTDPLALYRKEKENRRRMMFASKSVIKNQTVMPSVTPPKQTENTQNRKTQNYGKKDGKFKNVCIFAAIAFLLFLCAMILLTEYFT